MLIQAPEYRIAGWYRIPEMNTPERNRNTAGEAFARRQALLRGSRIA
jgi:hypothetical protein